MVRPVAQQRRRGDAKTAGIVAFFTRRVGNSDVTLPEWYATPRRPTSCRRQSDAWLRSQDIVVPPLDDAYMAKITAGYVAQKWLPKAADSSCAPHVKKPTPRPERDEDLLREAVHAIHPQARIDRVEAFAGAIGESITIQATAVRYGDSAALRPYRLHGVFPDAMGQQRACIEVMFKRKPHADAILEVVRRIAALAHPDTGVQIARAQHMLDVANCHQREIGIYRSLHARQAQYVPRL